MTARTRRLGIVALLVIGIVVMLFLVAREPDPGTPITLTFVRYDYGKNGAVIQITNRSDLELEFACMSAPRRWPDPDEARLSPHAMRELTLLTLPQRAPPTSGVQVVCWPAPTVLRSGIRRVLSSIGILDPPKQWVVSLDLAALNAATESTLRQ